MLTKSDNLRKGFTMNSNNAFLSLLLLMFIYLKLTGQIMWSWWWVLSPIWIPTLIVLVVFLCIVVIQVIDNSYPYLKKK